jgi:hypothetical protein
MENELLEVIVDRLGPVNIPSPLFPDSVFVAP